VLTNLEFEISCTLGADAACEVEHFIDKVVALVRDRTGCSRHAAELMVADLRREMEQTLESYCDADVSLISAGVVDFVAEGGKLETSLHDEA
jgi:hypothetical protein